MSRTKNGDPGVFTLAELDALHRRKGGRAQGALQPDPELQCAIKGVLLERRPWRFAKDKSGMRVLVLARLKLGRSYVRLVPEKGEVLSWFAEAQQNMALLRQHEAAKEREEYERREAAAAMQSLRSESAKERRQKPRMRPAGKRLRRPMRQCAAA